MVYDSKDTVKAVGKWKFDSEVHGNGFKGKGGVVGGDRVVGGVGVSCDSFDGLAGGTSSDKSGDKGLHMGPPVVFSEEKTSFQDTRVACCGGIMI